VAALVQLNGITDPNQVEAGSQLLVGATVPAPAVGTASPSVGAGLPAQVLAHPDRAQLQPLFHQWAGTFGVPVGLLEAMCWWESGWQSGVVSSTGAVGIGQLEPETVSSLRIRLGDPTLDPTAPSDNIEMSAALLHDLLVESGGNESVALASYYQGFASVSQNGMFDSTTQYVQGILSSMAGFS
jgi:soluble lytic murein transglycosylase-like protein